MEARPDPISSPRRQSTLSPAELGPILALLSRQLRRPLARLHAGLEVLAGNPRATDTSEARTQLGVMRDLADGLVDLTRDYFDYAALSEGVLVPRLESIRLSALIESIDARFGPEAGRRGLDWRCGVDGPDATVVADPAWCSRLLGGLVCNALRFTPPGGRLDVSARRDVPGWSLRVRDTGRGLTPDVLARAIEPFRRDREAGGRADGGIEGNGLGLPLVATLVARLGGRWGLENEPSGGTCVHAWFPDEGPAARS